MTGVSSKEMLLNGQQAAQLLSLASYSLQDCSRLSSWIPASSNFELVRDLGIGSLEMKFRHSHSEFQNLLDSGFVNIIQIVTKKPPENH